MWFPFQKKEQMFRKKLEELIKDTEHQYFGVEGDLEKLVSGNILSIMKKEKESYFLYQEESDFFTEDFSGFFSVVCSEHV